MNNHFFFRHKGFIGFKAYTRYDRDGSLLQGQNNTTMIILKDTAY